MGWRGILGFEYGIVQAPLGPDISGPRLVAAVANAGALGLLRAPDWVCSCFPLLLIVAFCSSIPASIHCYLSRNIITQCKFEIFFYKLIVLRCISIIC